MQPSAAQCSRHDALYIRQGHAVRRAVVRVAHLRFQSPASARCFFVLDPHRGAVHNLRGFGSPYFIPALRAEQ